MSFPPISDLTKLVLLSDVSTDAQIALNKNKKEKRNKNSKPVIEFLEEFKDINNFSSLKGALKSSSKYRQLYDDWRAALQKDRKNRDTINKTVFNNFVKLKEHFREQSVRSAISKEGLLGKIFSGEEVKSNLEKLFKILVKNKQDGSRIQNIRRNIPKEKRKLLYKLFVNNLPEGNEPTIEEFLNNSKPIYSFGLAELMLAEPSGKDSIEGWEKGEKKYNKGNISGTFEVWRKIFPSSDRSKYAIGGESKTESSEFVNLARKLGGVDEGDILTFRLSPFLPELLLLREAFSAKLELESIESVSAKKLSATNSLNSSKIKEYFNILSLAGKKENKGSRELYMRRLNNQRITNVVHFGGQGKKVGAINFVKNLLISPNNDSIFKYATKGVQVIPVLNKKQFEIQYKRKNPDYDSELEGQVEAFQRDYDKYLNNRRISQELVDIYLDYPEILEEEELSKLSKVGNTYHAITDEGVEVIRGIERKFKEFTQENPEEFDLEELGDAEKAEIKENSMVFAIQQAISEESKLSDILIDSGDLSKFYSKVGKQVDIVDCLVMSYYLVNKVVQVTLESKAEKIDTIVEEKGEGLSLEDPTLNQAVEDLAQSLINGLKQFNSKFRKELRIHLKNLVKNKESYAGIFSGETLSLLTDAKLITKIKEGE